MDNMDTFPLNDYTGQPPPPMMISTAPPREKTKRPQLSCNPCRARKVKCDRIQPCTACSLHQIAEICQYDLSETERQPILQAEALKEKDKAIAHLQHELAVLRGERIKSEPADEDVGGHGSRKMRLPPRSLKRPLEEDDHPFASESHDGNPFFDNPGLTNVADEFSHMSFHKLSSAFSFPLERAPDVFSFPIALSHPFPTLWSAKEDTSALIRVLPPDEDLFFYIDAFQNRVRASSFPYIPEECTHEEVQKFLENIEHNAALHPDALALLFTTLALGLQDGVFDRCGEKWVAGSVEAESKKGDVYIAAAMQCLRLGSFMNRPTLRTVAALVMMSPYLTNSGKFLDASALFGMTVRLAQSLSLHRDPLQLNSPVTSKEEGVRKQLWWWMLHMDQQFSMTLNRPLAISTMGDCPPPEPPMQDPTVQSLSNYQSHFCILGRQILSSGPWSNPQIDKFSDDLLALERTLPSALQFDVSWLNEEKMLPQWPMDVHAGLLHATLHNMLILLNRQRVEPGRGDINHRYMRTSTNSSHVPRGRERVLLSCRSLLIAFECFTTRVRAALMCWSLGQMAFNAAMILTLSMLETGETQDLMPVQQVYSAFLEVNKLGIHRLAGAAVDRLGNLMKEFRTEDSAKQAVMGQQGMMLLEDPGAPLSLLEDLPRLQDRIAGVMGRPGMDAGHRHSEASSFSKKKSSRKSNLRDPKNPQQKGSKKSVSAKTARRPVDRRFSDSVTPRPAQRRRLNRSTPSLSLMTVHPGQSVFSANSTPTVKSEAPLFTPQTFEGFPNSVFAASPTQTPNQGIRMSLDSLNQTLPSQQSQASQQQSQLNSQPSQVHQRSQQSAPPQQQSQQTQQQTQSQQQQSQPQPQSQQPQHSHPPSHHQQLHQQQQQQQQHQSLSHQHTVSDSGTQHDFLFNNQTTPYSSEFFDDSMASHNVDDHSSHAPFDHPPFTATPFSMAGEVPSSFAPHF